MEAKSSVDRLHDMVDKCYQEMSSRVHALELRETQRMSGLLSLPMSNDDPIGDNIGDMSSTILDSEPVIVGEGDMAGSEFWEELKRSRVYRRNSAFRVSTFSSEKHSTTWSFLSGLSMSEVSNFPVVNLAVTLGDVENPHRLSQTWSNQAVGPVWPLQPQMQGPAQIIAPGWQTLIRSDDDASSVHTVTGNSCLLPFFNNSKAVSLADSPDYASNSWPLPQEPFGNATMLTTFFLDNESIESLTMSDLEGDDEDCPCKGCGETLEGKVFDLGKEDSLHIEVNRELIEFSWQPMAHRMHTL